MLQAFKNQDSDNEKHGENQYRIKHLTNPQNKFDRTLDRETLHAFVQTYEIGLIRSQPLVKPEI